MYLVVSVFCSGFLFGTGYLAVLKLLKRFCLLTLSFDGCFGFWGICYLLVGCFYVFWGVLVVVRGPAGICVVFVVVIVACVVLWGFEG